MTNPIFVRPQYNPDRTTVVIFGGFFNAMLALVYFIFVLAGQLPFLPKADMLYGTVYHLPHVFTWLFAMLAIELKNVRFLVPFFYLWLAQTIVDIACSVLLGYTIWTTPTLFLSIPFIIMTVISIIYLVVSVFVVLPAKNLKDGARQFSMSRDARYAEQRF